MKRYLVLLVLFVAQLNFLMAAGIDRVEPMFWWVGMKNPNLQLMIHGENIGASMPEISYPGVTIESVTRVENPNYLFVDLQIAKDAQPGSFAIVFKTGKKQTGEFKYELKTREPHSSERKGFNSSDVIYLITPDRFANGNPGNDAVEGMKEQPSRADKDGRHGGDLQGIVDHLDYIQDLGFTAVWLNPVLENNMTKTSYHGYSTTDFYKVDPRYGSNDEYLELSKDLKKRGMKLIMDMIFNHCGSEHWWMDDMPMHDWINNYPNWKVTSHRRTVNQDPHASEADKKAMSDGWFVESMPDLNQRNPFMATYLIQNSIWWIEYVGLDGIRQDTWPYPDKHMMADWTKRVLEEYPNFNIVGEEWSMNPATVSYWQKGKVNSDGYECYLPSLMDFPLQNAASRAMNHAEDFDYGMIELYEALSNDYQYSDAGNLVVFPDNHDMSRFYTQVGEDVNKLKLGVAYFLTTRGIPQIYYGTEVLMSNKGTEDHGVIRSDYPGGWDGDAVNAFTGEGLTDAQKDMQNYVRTIQHWRKDKEVIHNGRLIHFVPEDGVYVYFRTNDEETVMVILNKNMQEKQVKTDRFSEVMGGFTTGKDIITATNLTDLLTIAVPAESAMIIELK
ncbi:glycoside hydrolase family 13 protein [Mangrovibacterium diazotrophicum]|uniref:Glycosidase n=1 Tax=Mangrovibacterium diazotrophicum TaxID=1261403 RepID=A0A419VUH8_9BACT|nr:glycoside hydrolase family 13 protein [Mangrovibacterium diazotrophicum]RKD85135.1 glycosidase [Mangrovibacterium diazotrophicum]